MVPPHRLIVSTDAKNEVDDQFAVLPRSQEGQRVERSIPDHGNRGFHFIEAAGRCFRTIGGNQQCSGDFIAIG